MRKAEMEIKIDSLEKENATLRELLRTKQKRKPIPKKPPHENKRFVYKY